VEAYKGLTKKTTILFPSPLHEHLIRVARQRGVSLGQLVRDACELQYGVVTEEDRLRAARAIGQLSLPVGSPEDLKRESVPAPEDLLP